MDKPEEQSKQNKVQGVDTVLVRCPNCGRSFYVDRSEIGKLRLCPVCNKESVFNSTQNSQNGKSEPPKP